ncbi:MAG: efflux transporter periplasmic adaptor subunit [Halieaceae bacterium]|mgnify:CR=1 FL=1|nr:efflux transporter periplasmic adaptor subunit [Halieaceae bacterium]
MIARLKRAAWPVGVGVAGIAVYALLQVTKPQPAPSVQPPRPISVEVVPAVRTTTRPTVVAFGEVRPGVRTQLVAQVGGKITSIAPAFIEGGRFEPGDILLTIEDTDYRAAVDERQARVAAAQVDLEQALADADVARKQLAGQKSPSPLALKKPQVARAEAALKAAETALALAVTNLERTRISLPFAGRVESQAADLGQYVNAGKVLGSVFGTDIAEVRLALTTGQLSALGIPIGFDGGETGGLPTTLSASLGGDVHRWQGSLTRLDAAIDPTTRTVYGTVQVQDPYGLAQSNSGMPMAVGLYVDAEIEGRLVADGIQIAAEGLRAGDMIFVLDGEGLLDVRQAEVIHRSRHSALLASGVEAGEQVIVSAIRNPVRGMRLEAVDTETVADSVGNQPVLNDNDA